MLQGQRSAQLEEKWRKMREGCWHLVQSVRGQFHEKTGMVDRVHWGQELEFGTEMIWAEGKPSQLTEVVRVLQSM